MKTLRLGLAALVVAACVSARADQADWRKDRQSQFSAWKAAHPRAEAGLANLKSKTAAMVAAAPHDLPPPDGPGVDRPPLIWRVPGAVTEVWDSPVSPDMVIIPAGEYTMGTLPSEPDREKWESPRHRVRIAYPFAVSKFDITRGEFAQFVAETKYDAKSGGCLIYDGKTLIDTPTANWENPGFIQADNEPVVCVSWNDANAYVKWLSRKTGHTYRLLSESEWEYAARAGTTTAYYWGSDIGGNNASCDGCGSQWDRKQTSPVGSFAPNAFGLYDMSGEVWQWLGDCANNYYTGAPADGSAWQAGDCSHRSQRGGAWLRKSGHARSAQRDEDSGVVTLHRSITGFRVARTL